MNMTTRACEREETPGGDTPKLQYRVQHGQSSL
jgi:hypothetical protein